MPSLASYIEHQKYSTTFYSAKNNHTSTLNLVKQETSMYILYKLGFGMYIHVLNICFVSQRGSHFTIAFVIKKLQNIVQQIM